MDRLPSGEPAMGASGQVNCDFNMPPPDDGDRDGPGDYDPGAAGQINLGGLDAAVSVGVTAPSGAAGGFDVNFGSVAPLKFQPGEINTHTLPGPLA